MHSAKISPSLPANHKVAVHELQNVGDDAEVEHAEPHRRQHEAVGLFKALERAILHHRETTVDEVEDLKRSCGLYTHHTYIQVFWPMPPPPSRENRTRVPLSRLLVNRVTRTDYYYSLSSVSCKGRRSVTVSYSLGLRTGTPVP